MNSQRLSKIIQERETQKVQNYLLELYNKLSSGQRNIIRHDMGKIKYETKI